MARFTQHELLHLQEHIRGEAASMELCRRLADLVTDPDLKSLCEQEASYAQDNVQRLMALFESGQTH
jgi:rubrerythrin